MDFFDSDVDGGINSEDTINGTSGDDSLSGGTGSSTLTGLDGNDTLIGGTGSNTITGGSGNDTLIGGTGSNNLDGGEDDDYLVGGNSDGFSISNGSVDTFEDTLTGGPGTDTFFFSRSGSTPESSTTVVNGEVVEVEDAINTIADFNSSEGDKIQIDGGSFGVAPGDTSIAFDNTTSILSIADEPVVEITSGVDSDVIANTEIVEGNEFAGDSVAVGGDGGDAINGTDSEDGGDAIATDGEVSVGEDGEDSDDGILDIYRFFETEKGFHFYTSSEAERDTVQQQIDNNELSYSYEGESFAALAEDDDGDPLTGAKPVYRFFNELTGAHLYTISETEKNNIADNLSDYSLEGVAYYAYDEPRENTIPLYRLYNSETGTHFFTPSTTEKDGVLDTLSQYSTEGEDGIAFYVLPTE